MVRCQVSTISIDTSIRHPSHWQHKLPFDGKRDVPYWYTASTVKSTDKPVHASNRVTDCVDLVPLDIFLVHYSNSIVICFLRPATAGMPQVITLVMLCVASLMYGGGGYA